MTQKKTYLSWLLGLICAFSLMIVFLITSVEAVAYWTPHYYENEYTRYQVADDVHMEMDDLLYVTDEMMAYLRGSRDDLNIDTVVDGTPREFFNAREKAHHGGCPQPLSRRTGAAPPLPVSGSGIGCTAGTFKASVKTSAATDALRRDGFISGRDRPACRDHFH